MSELLIREDEEIVDEIEGLIFKVKPKSAKESALWVAGLATTDGRVLRCKIDYNPWTGERL